MLVFDWYIAIHNTMLYAKLFKNQQSLCVMGSFLQNIFTENLASIRKLLYDTKRCLQYNKKEEVLS